MQGVKNSRAAPLSMSYIFLKAGEREKIKNLISVPCPSPPTCRWCQGWSPSGCPAASAPTLPSPCRSHSSITGFYMQQHIDYRPFPSLLLYFHDHRFYLKIDLNGPVPAEPGPGVQHRARYARHRLDQLGRHILHREKLIASLIRDRRDNLH